MCFHISFAGSKNRIATRPKEFSLRTMLNKRNLTLDYRS